MSSRASLAVDYGSSLFAPSLVVGSVFAWMEEGAGLMSVLIAGAIPAAASLVFILFCWATSMPLGNEERPGWESVLLPAVHVAFMLTIVALAASTSNPLRDAPAEVQPALMWLRPAPLLSALLCEMVALRLRPLFSQG